MAEVKVVNKIIYYKNRKVGVITKDGVFMTFRKEKDRFRMFDGWGFSKEVIRFLENIPAVWMVCIKTEKRLLKIPLWEIREKGIEWQNPNDKEDEQFVVPEKFFRIFSLEGKSLNLVETSVYQSRHD